MANTRFFLVVLRDPRTILVATLVMLGGCTAETVSQVLPELDDGKADFGRGVDHRGSLDFGAEVRGTFANDFEYHAYEVVAGPDAEFSLEVTHRDTAAALATALVVYGPRDERGARERIAHDFDSGWGAHSRIRGLTAPRAGVHTVVVGTADGLGRGRYNLELRCENDACDRSVEPLYLEEGEPNTEFMETFNIVDSEHCDGFGRSFYFSRDVSPSPQSAAAAIRQMRIAELELLPVEAEAMQVSGPATREQLDSWLMETWGYPAGVFEGAVGFQGLSYETSRIDHVYDCGQGATCSRTIMVALVPAWNDVWTLEFTCSTVP